MIIIFIYCKNIIYIYYDIFPLAGSIYINVENYVDDGIFC